MARRLRRSRNQCTIGDWKQDCFTGIWPAPQFTGKKYVRLPYPRPDNTDHVHVPATAIDYGVWTRSIRWNKVTVGMLELGDEARISTRVEVQL